VYGIQDAFEGSEVVSCEKALATIVPGVEDTFGRCCAKVQTKPQGCGEGSRNMSHDRGERGERLGPKE